MMQAEHLQKTGETDTLSYQGEARPVSGQPPKRVYVFFDAVEEEQLLADLERKETQERADLEENTMEQDEDLPGVSQTEATPTTVPSRHRRPVVLLFLLLMLFVLTIGMGSLAYLFLFPASVTITIPPASEQIQAKSALTVVSGTADGSRNEIPGRILPPLTMSQTQTQATTGTTYQQARPGRGTITFYNAALYSQTIVAGTLITGNDGVQVVTDEAVTVPAGTLATNGQAVVSAHSVMTGPTGNIKADDIYGDCCLLKISAVNSAFSGGEDAETYQSVAQVDIDRAEVGLKTKVTQAVTAAFQTQVQPNENLVTPLACQPTITTDHRVAEKATHVQVTESLSCTGVVYETQPFQDLITQAQVQTARQQQRKTSRLSGAVQATIQKATPESQEGLYRLTVHSTGTWVSQFSMSELHHLATQIAGKETKQTTRLLLQTSRVHHVSFSHGGTLPSDPEHIHIVLLAQQ